MRAHISILLAAVALSHCGRDHPAGDAFDGGSDAGGDVRQDGDVVADGAIECGAEEHACSGECMADDSVEGCGTSCTPCATDPNGATKCEVGECGIECVAGYHWCTDACYSDESPETCGESCTPCPMEQDGHMLATCVAGVCGSECETGYHWCTDECVSDESPESCGESCTPCPSVDNAVATCSAGTCGFECEGGYARDGDECRAWNDELVIGDLPSTAWPTLALDSAGLPHIAYDVFRAGDVNYAHWTGSEWDISTIVNTGVFTHSLPSIAVDGLDFPHIAYFDGSDVDLKYARWTGSEWEIEVVTDLTSNLVQMSIALDSSNLPHITYHDGDALNHVTFDGSMWAAEQISEVTTGVSSLVLDASDAPHVAFYEFDGSLGAAYATFDGTDWTTERIAGVSDSGNVDLALDSTGAPHVAFCRGHASGSPIYYAHRTDTGWDTESIAHGSSPSIAIDSEDVPHVAHYASTHWVSYASPTDSSAWELEDVVDAGAFAYVATGGHVVTLPCSLAFDAEDIAHIAYGDVSAHALGYTSRPF